MNIIEVSNINLENYMIPVVLTIFKDLNINPELKINDEYYGTNVFSSYYFKFNNGFKVNFLNLNGAYLILKNLNYLENQGKLPLNFIELLINSVQSTLINCSGILYRIILSDLYSSSNAFDYSFTLVPL